MKTKEKPLHVKIAVNKYGSCFVSEKSGVLLFQFEHRRAKDSPTVGPCWLCWLKGSHDPKIFHSRFFPRRFFKSACIATAFIRCELHVLPTTVIIDEGEKYLDEHPKE